MKPRSTFALRLLIATTAMAGPAAAQDAGWTGALSVYGWLPTVSGTATLPRSGLSTDLSSDGGDILEALNYAFFANGFGTTNLNSVPEMVSLLASAFENRLFQIEYSLSSRHVPPIKDGESLRVAEPRPPQPVVDSPEAALFEGHSEHAF